MAPTRRRLYCRDVCRASYHQRPTAQSSRSKLASNLQRAAEAFQEAANACHAAAKIGDATIDSSLCQSLLHAASAFHHAARSENLFQKYKGYRRGNATDKQKERDAYLRKACVEIADITDHIADSNS